MKVQHPQAQSKQPNPFAELAAADCELWRLMIARVNEPDVAQLLVEFLDSEPAMRSKRTGVYLAAHATLDRAEKQRQDALQKAMRAAAAGRLAARAFAACAVAMRFALRTVALGLRAAWVGAAPVFKPTADRHNRSQASAPGVVGLSRATSANDEHGPKEPTSADLRSTAQVLQWPSIGWPEDGAEQDKAAIH